VVDESKFQVLLRDQIRNEFTASQQYTAVAVFLDDEDLPQLAAHFYAQALEERNHAMAIVQYLLDSGHRVAIPGIGEVRNDFATVEDVVELALAQEKEVTAQVTTLARTARDEGDYLGEQFMQWFLKEQVEEVASMTPPHRLWRADGSEPRACGRGAAHHLRRAARSRGAPPPAGGQPTARRLSAE